MYKQGQRLSVANLDEAQRATIRQVEAAAAAAAGGDDAWLIEKDHWKLIGYRDHLACRRAEGKPVPAHVAAAADGLSGGAMRQMQRMFDGGSPFTPDPQATRTEALRLAIGRMLTHVLDVLGRPDGALHLYSAHDWTVSPLLMAVAREDDPLLASWPPFCSEISFELWTEQGSAHDRRLSFWPSHGAKSAVREEARHVRVLFNGQPVDMPCSERGAELCRLADFRRMLSRLAVQDYEAECRANVSEPIVRGSAARRY